MVIRFRFSSDLTERPIVDRGPVKIRRGRRFVFFTVRAAPLLPPITATFNAVIITIIVYYNRDRRGPRRGASSRAPSVSNGRTFFRVLSAAESSVRVRLRSYPLLYPHRPPTNRTDGLKTIFAIAVRDNVHIVAPFSRVYI